MERMKYFRIGHEDHVFCNPLSEQKVDEIVALLDLAPGSRVIDIACGKGEVLRRIAQQYDIEGVGVDLEASWVDEAGAAAAALDMSESVRFVQHNGATFTAQPDSFDVAMCLGASWIWQGHRGTLSALARWVRPGGLVVVGEPFWRCEPTPDYLRAAELPSDLCVTHAGNVEIGIELGFKFLHSIVSNEDDWDRYEGYQCRAIEKYAYDNSGDPDVPELLAQLHRARDAYLNWGRDELGWAVYLFKA